MNAEMIAALREIETERNISFESLARSARVRVDLRLQAQLRRAKRTRSSRSTVRPATTKSITAATSSKASREDPKLEISKAEAGSKYEAGRLLR